MTETVPQRVGAPLLDLRRLRISAETASGVKSTIVSSMELSVGRGEAVAIVGESGSGKSMTAKALAGLLPSGVSASGELWYRGENLLEFDERSWRGIRGREIGLIVQDPFTSLNPVLRCGRIITESLLPPGRHRGQRDRLEAIRRLAEVGITDETVYDRYPFQLSGGMRQRVAIAAALCRDPEVLIADEPSTALDVSTQREVLNLIKSIQEARGMGLILITHDLRVAFSTCTRIYVLYAGSVVEVGDSSRMAEDPQHPYTRGLLLSEPRVDRRSDGLVAMPGSVPTADDVAGMCTFAPRCEWVEPLCKAEDPRLRRAGDPGQLSACVRLAEIRGEMVAHAPATDSRSGSLSIVSRPAPVLAVSHARKIFHSGARTVAALEDVSIQVGAGESVGIVGESGSGKTTLARVLVGLESLTAGEVSVGEMTVRDWARQSADNRRILRSTVQTVFQDPYSSLNPMWAVGWTLREAIRMGGGDAKDRKARVDELLRMVGLDPSYARRRPSALSGGERQRVAIARALAVKPRVLICDEPTSALDVSVQAQILNLLGALRMKRELSYLFITHNLSVVRQVCDFVYVMHQGRVVESGETGSVLSKPRHAYTRRLVESVP